LQFEVSFSLAYCLKNRDLPFEELTLESCLLLYVTFDILFGFGTAISQFELDPRLFLKTLFTGETDVLSCGGLLFKIVFDKVLVSSSTSSRIDD